MSILTLEINFSILYFSMVVYLFLGVPYFVQTFLQWYLSPLESTKRQLAFDDILWKDYFTLFVLLLALFTTVLFGPREPLKVYGPIAFFVLPMSIVLCWSEGLRLRMVFASRPSCLARHDVVLLNFAIASSFSVILAVVIVWVAFAIGNLGPATISSEIRICVAIWFSVAIFSLAFVHTLLKRMKKRREQIQGARNQ